MIRELINTHKLYLNNDVITTVFDLVVKCESRETYILLYNDITNSARSRRNCSYLSR